MAADKRSNGKPDKVDKEGRWVWRWSEKLTDDDGNTKIQCLVKGCTQKKGYALITSSASNIKNHLLGDHKLSEANTKDSACNTQSGPLESDFSKQGKRSSAHFSTEALERHVCKILVRHKGNRLDSK
ncbi:hypothetical protein BGX28_002258 [Mortierella sp. GBA30]|nr:hypothetical protein BGX28_002258 [Mortierella sp. GBA30]